ncbi:MAG: hypothetical protein IPG80_06405 [Anaerolineales bacterium]|uniref:hypothetical protein n=1 Tax=Candidatus Villigracilis vicinus TaxID=3140679 RepID=UPI00313703A0|nr:hypothetical protein [Anaerolineales bacterium]MBK7449664.1 hypothetical protein [Anaerolineales bacterium]MBK9782043.1 hypothetical protein [Anaerolineales bacterium]
MKRIFLPIFVLTLIACSAPVDVPPPPTSIFSATPLPTYSTLIAIPATSIPATTPTVGLNEVPALLTSIPENYNPTFCQDTRALQLVSLLQTSIKSRNGELLASLVSPTSGVGVRYLRGGNVVTYFDNIKFIFETTYQADWGPGIGSGEPVKGSFQDVVLPSLEKVFEANAVVTCNELRTGGVTYLAEWPYNGMEYYSIHFPGTDQNGGLDWETWAVGMVREEGKPMLAALVHFVWEP